jgi:hypothetical protein
MKVSSGESKVFNKSQIEGLDCSEISRAVKSTWATGISGTVDAAYVQSTDFKRYYREVTVRRQDCDDKTTINSSPT